MKPYRHFFLSFFSFCLLFSQTALGQNFRAVDDTVCIQLGVPFAFNVKDNDLIPPGVNAIVVPLFQSNCVRLTETGELLLISDSQDCCGVYTFGYRYENCDDPAGGCFGKIELTIKCPKPDCSIIDLSEFLDNRNSGGNPDLPPACVDVCAESEVTFFLPNLPGFSYSWSASGGTVLPGSHPAEVNITWGAAGTGNITVTITDSLNVGITRNICVNILPKPVASFTKSATSICLNGSITFTNTSTGGNSYYWDFGDGSSSAMFSPTHQFNSPGTYDVCLYVTKDNVDPRGNPLCCCTDTMCMEITVDSLPGPNIYWISTLCAGDSSIYWTDAANCSSYQWTVLDHNGVPLVFTGQGNDTISVVWGNGPFGTVTLEVSGCSQTYCDEPVTVVVPIIAPTSAVSGPTVVCQNETATYTLPKWPGVYYDWNPIGGGTVISGQGTNVVTIQWGFGTAGTITVNYSSPFLQGLPGHSPPDCSGTATLNVQIRPKFTVLTSPSVLCVNSVSTVFASPFGSYTWTVSPAAVFTGQGSGAININWTAPGTYTVTAIPVNTATYCNSSASVVIQVLDVPAPDSITGPLLICPGETQTYFGYTSASGTVLNWTVTGGTPVTGSGNSITVTWGASGPYTLLLSQSLSGQPMCNSPAIQLTVQAKQIAGPLAISGPPGCINSTQMYSAAPAQLPDAMFNWTISPVSAGSVVNGQGTPNIDVQWNNTPGTATLTLAVTLCGLTQTHSIPVVLNAPVVPVITQTGVLCPGNTVTIGANGGFSGYMWSTSATTQSITVSTPGTYTVKTTDANGCMVIVPYQVTAAPGPVASISTGSPTSLCILPPSPASSTLVALTGAGNNYQWVCNNTPQGAPSPTATTFTHNNTNVAGTFTYWVVVTAPNGCTSISNAITVVQDTCESDEGCIPDGLYSLSFSSVNQTPNCNVVNFTTFTNNVTLSGWNFGDPGGNGNSGTLAAAQHTYSRAGCFFVELTGTTPGTLSDGSPANCLVRFTDSVCVPVVADFEYVVGCSPAPLTATFTNLVSILPGETILSYFWNFGDSNTSTAANPVHGYASAGTYPVTLTVTLLGGCQATITQNVVVTGLGAPSISINPNPPCAGQPVQSTGAATGNIISWLWNFGNGATNGSQSPSQTYLMDGPYTVTLTVMDAEGCTNSSSQNIVVQPTPSGVITPSTTSPVCTGQSVTLTAPTGTGYTYLWSDNSTGPTLTVTSSGTYSVQVTLGPCSYTTPAVTVTVLPPPPAVISGNPVICDMGCTTLLAPPGYTYQWLDPVNSIPGQTGASLQVCSGSLLPAYAVSVTDGNGCSAVSAPVTVTVAVSPSFAVNAAPTPACEGTPSVLTVSPVQPNVAYSWSNGGNGTSITVLQAGTYTATGVDTLTGCSSSAFATVNPLPDLCLVPTGCYKACDPDTICGPAGLASYQWNFNGAPISGATDSCLIVTQTGSYSLTGTTAAGCSATSDTLILELMDCGCEDQLSITATPVPGDTCCWSVSYNNIYTGALTGLAIHTQDAEFDFDLSSLNPALQVVGISSGNIVLTATPFGSNMPQGALNNFLKFCLKNTTNAPQQVIFDWYDDVFDIVCSDTLEFDCPVEPDCLYLLSDSIYCENKEVKYTFTVCNPNDAAFSVGYILLQPVSPAGVTITPPAINASPAIAPGECRTYTVVLGGGTGIFGDTLCFNMLAHDFDPATVDTALCCSLDTLYCIAIPDCEPCDDIEVVARPIGPTGTGPCCFNVTLINNFSGNYFDGVGLCLITPGTTFSTFANTLGSGWATISYSPAVIMLDVIPPLGNALPLGVTTLPVLCINTAQFANPMMEIKWMQGDSVVCRDTVVLSCFPPCGYFSEEEVVCAPNGGWLYQGNFNNTSPYTINQLNMVFTSPPGLGAYNQNLPGTPVPPGGQLAFNIPIGAPAVAGDSVCFTLAMHDTLNVECCNVRHCIELPDCPEPCIDSTLIDLSLPCLAIYDPVCGCDSVTYSNACVARNHFGVTSWTAGPCPQDLAGCRCDDAFAVAVQAGFTTAVLASPPAAPFTYRFTPPGSLLPCDRLRWRFRRFPINAVTPWVNMGNSNANAPFTYTFAGTGIYQVCMLVERTTPEGEVCSREVCVFVNVFAQLRDDPGEMVSIAPNPFNGQLFASSLVPESTAMDILVRDLFGKELLRFRNDEFRAGEAWPIDLTGLAAGVYLLECTGGGRKQVLRVVKQ